jgi:hypothetical protein
MFNLLSALVAWFERFWGKLPFYITVDELVVRPTIGGRNNFSEGIQARHNPEILSSRCYLEHREKRLLSIDSQLRMDTLYIIQYDHQVDEFEVTPNPPTNWSVAITAIDKEKCFASQIPWNKWQKPNLPRVDNKIRLSRHFLP